MTGRESGWYWRDGSARYDFRMGGERYRGKLGIRQDSGTVDGKSAERRADEAMRRLKAQLSEKTTIMDAWEQTKKRLAAANHTPVDFDVLWDLFVKRSMANIGAGRTSMYRHYLTMWVDWMHANHPAADEVSKVTEAQAREYVSHVRSLPGAAATKNVMVAFIKRLFRVLGRDCGVIENPFDCPDIKPLAKEQTDREVYTPEQIEVLFTATGPLYQLFVTALCTFQREGDCCLIKRDWIDLEHNYIHFPYTRKTGVKIDLPMLPRFRALAEEQLSIITDSEYLFPELADMYLRQRTGAVSAMVKKFLAEHGFKNTTVEVPGYARKVSVLDVHSLRHTAAAMAVLHGWPINMVMKATGHKTVSMVMHYMDHITEQQKVSYFDKFGGAIEHAGDDPRREMARLADTLPLAVVERIVKEYGGENPRQVALAVR